MQRARMMVVEDETIVALDLESRLQLMGYKVVATATRGEDAIRKAAEHRPDLVLMDIILDGPMDGIQAAEVIRERLKTPVIFLTACADEPTLERAKVTEPFGYILKPFEDRELHGHIEIALYKHAMEKRLKESEERYSLATQGANDGLWDWDITTGEVYFSPRWKAMLGYEDGQIAPNPEEWFRRLHPEDRSVVEEKIKDHFGNLSSHFESEYRIMARSGGYRWMLSRGLAMRDERGRPCRFAGSQTDITERKVYDPLTGLPNRTLLMDRLDRAVERASRSSDYGFAVLALDVENFKIVNDGFGYGAEDQLLIQIAQRLKKCVRAADTVAHLGEDDFVLVLEDLREANEATNMASLLHSELSRPFLLGAQKVYITSNIGITLSSKGHRTPADLLREATTAMRRAKALGQGQSEIFDEDMRSQAVARLRIEADLRNALRQNDLRVYYQPIVQMATGLISGFEALVRWQNNEILMLPGEFIPVAEASDLIVQLERWVLRTACEQLQSWQSQLPPGRLLTLSVNFSPRQYCQEDLVPEIIEILSATGCASNSLKLEITESALMQNSETIASTLARIQDLKVQVHLDDFGTGYSSLSYLHRFPINNLKIDKSFVSNMSAKNETRKIVQAIVMLARNLGMEVTAEGVETLWQVRELQGLGCQFAQGYYFSRPLDARAAGALLLKDPSWVDLLGRDVPSVIPFRLEGLVS